MLLREDIIYFDNAALLPTIHLTLPAINMRMFYILLLTIPFTAFAQEKSVSRFFVDAGIVGRFAIFYNHSVHGQSGPLINGSSPYTYLKGVNGTGLNVGFGYTVSREYDVKLTMLTTLRYDFYYVSDNDETEKTIYFDQSVLLSKSFFKKYYLGLGFTTYNIARELHYINGNRDLVLPLPFNSIDFLFGLPIWKVYFEPKVSIVQNDFPGTIKENTTLLGARVFYRLSCNR